MIPLTGRGPPPHQVVCSGLWLKYSGIWLNSRNNVTFLFLSSSKREPLYSSRKAFEAEAVPSQ